ncbi:MAG: hypothetical protein VW907_10040, partial [Opitutae bacterium]
MSTSTTGTGTITLGSAETGYQTFADAGVADGDVVRYVIEDGNDWEIGSGTYTATGTTLSRTVSESSNADAALNLTGSAVVFITAAAGDVFQGELFAENPSSPTAPSATGTNAVAIGDSATASAQDAISIGDGATNAGAFAVAIGWNAAVTSNGTRGIAIGSSATTDGNKAFAAGDRATIPNTGTSAVALGYSYASGASSFAAVIDNNTSSYGATGANSIAMGYQAKATGDDSIAIGEASRSFGNFRPLAVGYNAYASQNYSTAIGPYTQATNTNCLAIGYTAYATGYGAIAVGYATSDAARSIAIGERSRTNGIAGAIVFSNGTNQSGNVGDSQAGIYILKG